MELGSIAEWVGIVVSIFGFGFLALTFESQLKAQLGQQEITKLEQENFRLRFLPDFTAVRNDERITVTIINNPIKILRTFYPKTNKYKYYNLYEHYGEPNALGELSVGMKMFIDIPRDTISKGIDVYDTIIFYYLDRNNELYERKLLFDFVNRSPHPQISTHIKRVKDIPEFKGIVSKYWSEENLRGNNG